MMNSKMDGKNCRGDLYDRPDKRSPGRILYHVDGTAFGWVRSCIVLFIFLLWPVLSHAYFFDYGNGVRPAGLGRAYVAVADDVNAVNWNPAGLAAMDRYEITTMYASLFAGFEGRLFTGQRDLLGYNYIAAAVPIDDAVGAFGGSWSQFSSALYRENIFTLSYARTIQYDFIKAHVGANFKILNWAVDGTDYSQPLSKTGFTSDIAVLYPLPEKFTVGVNYENFIPANMGVTTTEYVPGNFRIGASWRQDLRPQKSFIDNLLVSLEIVNRSYAQNKNTVRFGAESTFLDGLLAGRLGVNSTEFTFSFSGCYTFEQLNQTQIQLDYSFTIPFYVQETYGTHRIALTASWGKLGTSKVEQAEKVLSETITLNPEENLAKKRDQELAARRAAEEAKLKAMTLKLRAEIEEVQSAIREIELRVKNRELPAIRFEADKHVLKKRALRTLDAIGTVLEKHPDVKVRVEGHTDKSGNSKGNLTLSQARVETVCDYLVTLYKVKKENLIPVGFGDTRPIATNSTPEGRMTNRRVEFKVLIPSGLEQDEAGIRPEETEKGKQETIDPQDIVSYESLDQMREKLKVYEIKMNPDEVEELFKQQHQENGNTPTPKAK